MIYYICLPIHLLMDTGFLQFLAITNKVFMSIYIKN